MGPFGAFFCPRYRFPPFLSLLLACDQTVHGSVPNFVEFYLPTVVASCLCRNQLIVDDLETIGKRAGGERAIARLVVVQLETMRSEVRIVCRNTRGRTQLHDTQFVPRCSISMRTADSYGNYLFRCRGKGSVPQRLVLSDKLA